MEERRQAEPSSNESRPRVAEGRRSGIKRQLPSVAEVARFAGPAFTPKRAARWERVLTVADFRRLAKRRTPRPVFDYVEGAAERELSVARSVQAFGRVVFHPHVLRNVGSVEPSTTILGRRAALPMVLAPTGFTRMMRTEGEPAVARSAARAGIPYALSTLGTTSVDRLRAEAPDTELWFQLYLSRDHGRSRELLDRANASGYTALVVTVDVPVAGARLRDSYNGLTLPPTLTLRTLIAMAAKPRWLFDTLTTEPLAFEALGAGKDLVSLFKNAFDPGVTFADLEWLRAQWRGSLVVKGIQRLDDAKAATSAGVDAIAVSNHGGRQLDRAATPLVLLPEVVDALGGKAEVFLDGGIRSGADVAAAVALGARAAFIGRPYLYALMAGGESGVDHLLKLFAADYVRTLKLLGVSRTADLSSDLVTSI
jgi:L-lactate dehydrogenase (cytochrome)